MAAPGTRDRETVPVEAFLRGLDVFRPLGALYAAYLAWTSHARFVRPWLAWTVIGAIVLWSLGLLLVRRRTLALAAVELVIAVGGVLATTFVLPAEAITAGEFTLPTVWAASPVVFAAVLLGLRGGVAAAVVVAAADLVENPAPSSTTVHNIVLLFLLGGLIGLAVDLARGGQAREEAILRERERLAERERLSRVVHDGVLQALAFIHRRGTELGGPAVELAELAAGQERALRRLVSGVGQASGEGGEVDVRQLLTAYEGSDVDVSLPATPVLLPADRAAELGAAVAAALDNVARHAGAAAHAWVLLEGRRDEVVVTVRDNGVGADPGLLEAAAGGGRMGVARSIRGRLTDLGGTATWTTRPGGGCTVRLRVPVETSMGAP